MTALAGVWRLDGAPDAGAACRRMIAAQRIYGTEAADPWEEDDIALGRGLFQLLPEDRYDRQPLIGAGGRIVLVADVRLDNRDELCAALGLRGERELCDAAIVLAAFEHWADAAFGRLLGDFAIAIFDRADRRLLLVRDPLGQRPLHYHRSAKLVAFASMPKGLHALAEVPRGPDMERVAEFVAVLPESGSRTCFAGIERVESGHIVTIGPAGIEQRRYWNPAPGVSTVRSAEEWAEGLRHHLDQAVAARLRGVRGAVATHLSAGLDSSTVTATAARLMRAAGGRVVAYTSVPLPSAAAYEESNRICDEGPLAALTASLHPNIEHVLVPGKGASPLDLLDRYFYLFEQPVRDLPSGVWYCEIMARAQQSGHSVLLPAYMGNLTLSYEGTEHLATLVAKGSLLRFAREARALVRMRQRTWRNVVRAGLGPLLPPALWRRLAAAAGRAPIGITGYSGLNPERASEMERLASERSQSTSLQPGRDSFSTRLWALRRIDMGNVNKGTLGGWGIDQRDPMTDRRFVEFCLTIPDDQLIVAGATRALARHAFTDRVPHAVLDERRRGYQSADWIEGVKGQRDRILEELEHQEHCESASYALDFSRLRRLAQAWPEPFADTTENRLNYRQILLRGLAAGHFCRKASGSNL